MKEDVGYEKFLAAVYEAENEGSENKVLNMKVKAMTVGKIIDEKEQNDLKDLKQQIESLAMIMKVPPWRCEIKGKGRGFLPKEERDVWEHSSERGTGIT